MYIPAETLKKIAETHDSFYLYDERSILERTARLKAAFPSVEFLYSVKCNPAPRVLSCIFGQGFGADAASLGEVLRAERAGLKRDRIYYSAPGKTMADIEGALSKAVLIADSLDEIRRIEAAAERAGRTEEIGLRINPNFSFYGGPGETSKFGIDEDQAAAFLREGSCPHVRVTGIHVHLHSQELDAAVLERYYGNMLALAERMETGCGLRLEYVNMGSGIGIPYSEDDVPLDVEKLGAAAAEALAEFKRRRPGLRLMIETGRFAVGKSGLYVTKVLDRKASRGKTYIILKNTLNGFIRPSVEKMVEHCSPDPRPPAWEPLFTHSGAFGFYTLKEDGPREEVTLVGNLCTATDVVAENILLPRLECGDLVAVTNAGAYAAVLSPMQFASQEPPAERFLTSGGEVLE